MIIRHLSSPLLKTRDLEKLRPHLTLKIERTPTENDPAKILTTTTTTILNQFSTTQSPNKMENTTFTTAPNNTNVFSKSTTILKPPSPLR
jgi:hypothetical protein